MDSMPLRHVSAHDLPYHFLFRSTPVLVQLHTLARSIGWMTQVAKDAANPPHTKGSAVLAMLELPLLFELMMVSRLIDWSLVSLLFTKYQDNDSEWEMKMVLLGAAPRQLGLYKHRHVYGYYTCIYINKSQNIKIVYEKLRICGSKDSEIIPWCSVCQSRVSAVLHQKWGTSKWAANPRAYNVLVVVPSVEKDLDDHYYSTTWKEQTSNCKLDFVPSSHFFVRFFLER